MSSGNKFARAAGRGQFRPPPNRGLVQVRHGQAPSKRTPLGHGKDATGSITAGSGGNANMSREESFQLMPHPSNIGPPFAMVIRLQPEILEELKQAEADGIESVMKFGTNALGHVIQVGSETFKFASAPEPGDLCDIYEQRKGESGEAVLIEAGSAWRKLSVLRILSATEKDRVKKRTAEAEKKQRERKSILVDPSTQMIIPQAAAAEANGRKPLPKLAKEPPPKKRKVTMSPIKQNTHSSSTVVTGNHQFSSPASPSFEPPAIPPRGSHTNHVADMHPSKGHAMPERTIPPLANKGPAIPKDKTRTPAAPARPDSGKSGSATNVTDLRSFLIALMQENPKGVTIKAIEKAVAESLPAVPEKKVLDKVMKSIASYHAPGKYLLNPGVENGNFSDPMLPNISGRAQEAVRPSTHEEEPLVNILEREAVKEKREPASFDKGPSSVLTHHSEHSTKEALPELGGALQVDSSIPHENVLKQNATHVSKDPSTGGSESSSSSGSGSASDSDTDSSGSGSGSDSGSGSGSDSASSSSTGASMDEDVDIMSDDDAEKKLDVKQKSKGRESKLVSKEDVKVQEKSNFKEEAYENSIPLNHSIPVPILDQPDCQEPDARAKATENIIESVFGPDEVSDFTHDNLGEHAKPEQSSHIKSANVKYGDRKISAKTQNYKESRERDIYDEAQRSATRDNEALRIDEALDMLVDKVSGSKEADNSSVVGNRVGFSSVGFSSAQQEHRNQPSKPVGLGFTKDIDKKRADPECISRPSLDRRERDAYDGRWASRNLSSSVEISKVLSEGSPMDLGEHLQNAVKTPLDMPKQSPIKVINDSRHYTYDSRSGKRRPEEIENAETERSKKRAGAAHVKQPIRKEEWCPAGPVKQNHTDKGRFSASNSQEYPSVRSDEEPEELYRRPKVSQVIVSSSEFCRDHMKAGDSLDNAKRQTPQSNDELEGGEFFAPYEKKKPELRGSINTFQEYKEYCKEYHEKYPIYTQLNDAIKLHQKSFESLRRDMERAKSKDDEKKLAHTCGKIKREYALHHKKRRRMCQTFQILHEELKVIKARCKEYAEKVGQG